MNLYINCCVREESRTDRLAHAVINKIGGDFHVLDLYSENIKPLDNERLSHRMELCANNDFSDTIFDLAKQFASAETIVIAAPYWDSSFPSMLKIYLENIYVIGIVTDYDDKGMSKGLCSAKKLYYVTTAGGVYDSIYSYGYIENLAKNYFGIKQTELVKAEMLDIVGFDAEDILQREIHKWQ